MMTYLLHLPVAHITGLLLLAAILGGLVGWQREQHDHPAGLRTHILVCVGAALIAAVDNHLPNSGGRIAAQVVTGVGFLGAGTILRSNEGFAVRGLTTAASVWTIAGIGIAVGYGGVAAQAAVAATIIVLFTLTIVNLFEIHFLRRLEHQKLSVVLATEGDPLGTLQTLLGTLKSQGVKVRNFRMEKMSQSEIARFSLQFPKNVTRDAFDVLLSENKGIIHYDWDE
jgi:putative Mg2+ transporter-C (MgtC) family protein